MTFYFDKIDEENIVFEEISKKHHNNHLAAVRSATAPHACLQLVMPTNLT